MQSVARGRGELIYADLGSVTPCNKPAIPPPPADRVIYSDAREFKPKVRKINFHLLCACLFMLRRNQTKRNK